ncbi:PREDICTED: uncharacterized protein LOC109233289 [Nicotiana attenuata]|uniref:uncharacterized protein LOC109233289 n=1 Tax=Nicotiana attenuata TaxID=49451 RepID=UPI000904AC92|nr:PREDICTED: uncharacterized protein LOC109233289 [Nicotiana attenuata]
MVRDYVKKQDVNFENVSATLMIADPMTKAQRRLLTRDRLANRRITDNLMCPLCNNEAKAIDHVFFKCGMSAEIWSKLLQWQGIYRQMLNWQEELLWGKINKTGRNAEAELYIMVLAGCNYHVWQERNIRIFQEKQRSVHGIIKQIIQEVTCKGTLKPKLERKLVSLNFYP